MKTFKHLLITGFSVLVLFFVLTQCKTDGFTSTEHELIFSANAETIMPLFTINSESDSVLLRQQARMVKKKHIGTKTLEHLKMRMLATVNDSTNSGVGIAAPQVGIPIRMIYVQRFDKTGEPFEIYYNPVILEYGDSINSGPEGCLSVPDYRGNVIRSHNITITYLDSVGNSKEEKVNDFVAVIFQHEIDHVNGILYYDHITNGFESLNN